MKNDHEWRLNKNLEGESHGLFQGTLPICSSTGKLFLLSTGLCISEIKVLPFGICVALITTIHTVHVDVTAKFRVMQCSTFLLGYKLCLFQTKR